MSEQIRQILSLADTLAKYDDVTHWAISKRLSGKGDFLSRLMEGGDLHTRTAEDAVKKLSAEWPEDLERRPENLNRRDSQMV